MAWRLLSFALLALTACDHQPADQPREERSKPAESGFQLSQIANLALPQAMASLQKSEDGQALAPYLVKCALPIERRMAAGREDLPGGMGLVPEWNERPMTVTERRWISACLLALMNASGEHVEVSVTGNHANLPSSAEEPAFREYGLQSSRKLTHVVLSATACNDRLRLVIEDDGRASEAAQAKPIGSSMDLARMRLEHAYAGQYQLSAAARPDRGYAVQIEVPLRMAADS